MKDRIVGEQRKDRASEGSDKGGGPVCRKDGCNRGRAAKEGEGGQV